MDRNEFKDALTKRGFRTKEGRFGAGPHQEVTIPTKGTFLTITVFVIEKGLNPRINVNVMDGPDSGQPMLDTATFATAGRPGAFERALQFVDTYR